jgi:putative salt-induced outer membrane protein YdiY
MTFKLVRMNTRLAVAAFVAVASATSIAKAQVAASGASAPAATVATEAVTAKSYEGTAEVSSIVTNGNTKNQTTGAALDLTYKPDPWLVNVKSRYLTTISQEIQTQESFELAGRGGRKLSDLFDLFVEHTYLKNRFAGLENRYITSAGAGYFALKNDKHTLKTELLLGYTDEERTDLTRPQFMSGGGSILYKWKVAATSEFTHETKYQPNFKTSEDWRLISETAVSAAISSMLSSKIAWRYEHVNLPPAGKVKGDTTTTVSLLTKF